MTSDRDRRLYTAYLRARDATEQALSAYALRADPVATQFHADRAEEYMKEAINAIAESRYSRP